MNSVAAFFDDSGGLDPGSGHDFVCFGMVVLPVDSIRVISNEWNTLIARHLRLNADVLAVNGVEAKSSELYELSRRLKNGQAIAGAQAPLYNWGLNTAERVDELIEGIWGFLSDINSLTFLASIVNKPANLMKYKEAEYIQFLLSNKPGLKDNVKNLRRELALFLCKGVFEYLLQRLNYLGNSGELNYSDAFLIGDECSLANFMYKSQAEAQAGFSQFTNLPKIANNIWFGASSHNPCLQISDWIAYAVRTWAEKRQGANIHLKRLFSHFRGFPENILGWGIVPIPDASYFPKLPM